MILDKERIASALWLGVTIESEDPAMAGSIPDLTEKQIRWIADWLASEDVELLWRSKELLLTVCVAEECRWSHPTYLPQLIDVYEKRHTAQVPEHDRFKRITIDQHNVLTVT